MRDRAGRVTELGSGATGAHPDDGPTVAAEETAVVFQRTPRIYISTTQLRAKTARPLLPREGTRNDLADNKEVT